MPSINVHYHDQRYQARFITALIDQRTIILDPCDAARHIETLDLITDTYVPRLSFLWRGALVDWDRLSGDIIVQHSDADLGIYNRAKLIDALLKQDAPDSELKSITELLFPDPHHALAYTHQLLYAILTETQCCALLHRDFATPTSALLRTNSIPVATREASHITSDSFSQPPCHDPMIYSPDHGIYTFLPEPTLAPNRYWHLTWFPGPSDRQPPDVARLIERIIKETAQ